MMVKVEHIASLSNDTTTWRIDRRAELAK